MTDSQSEVIQWWAEKVGWILPSKIYPKYNLRKAGIGKWPIEERWQLLTLAGLAEDWLRERVDDEMGVDSWDDECAIKLMNSTEDYEVIAKHKDPTLAKLLAFRSLAEKLDG